MWLHSDIQTQRTGPADRPAEHETILLAITEDGARRYARRTLRGRGYTVLEATDGLEAIRIGQEHRGPIQLLIADYFLPGGAGREVAAMLRVRHPELHAQYLSGCANVASVAPGGTAESAPVLRIPFGAGDLVQKVQAVLNENVHVAASTAGGFLAGRQHVLNR